MAKQSSIRIRSKRLKEGVQVRTLIAHPMENGRTRDETTGKILPAHFIHEISVMLNDRVVIRGNLGGGIAKDPFFTFLLKDAKSGDKITISWLDNQQVSDSKDHVIK